MNEVDRTPGYVNKLSDRLDELQKSIDNASASSDRLTKALAWLTGALVLVAMGGLALQFMDARSRNKAEYADFSACMYAYEADVLPWFEDNHPDMSLRRQLALVQEMTMPLCLERD